MEMYLSRMLLDPLNKEVVTAMRDIYKFHELVMSGFKGRDSVGRVLFRLEPEQQDGVVRVLVQSPVEPFWQTPPEGLKRLQCRKIFLDFPNGTLMPFRLRANTVVTREGKRLGLVREDALRDWLLRRSESIGVEFIGFDVADEGYSYGKQFGNNGKGRQLAFKAARFDGQLRVCDPEIFSKKLSQGVGPAKGFGHGLLSVRYPRQ